MSRDPLFIVFAATCTVLALLCFLIYVVVACDGTRWA